MTLFQNKNNTEQKNLRQQFNDYVDGQTMKYQQQYGFELNPKPGNRTWNVEADAFKHTFMQARLTFDWSTPVAKTLGDYHEFVEGPRSKQPQHEKNMDLWNNRMGQRIGREVRRELRGQKIRSQSEIDDIFAKKIMEQMKAGKLITDPNDPRARTLGEKFNNWSKELLQPKTFKSLNTEKQLSIKNPSVSGISGGADNSLTPMQITYPQPVVNTGAGKLAWLGQLGNLLSTAGRLAGFVAGGMGGSVSGVPTGVGESIVPYIDPNIPTIMPAYLRHTGGKITPQPIANTLKKSQSHDEVLAILRGGETVRTEAQERELQEEKYKDLMNFIGPMLQEKEQKPKTIAEAYDPNNKVPCLLNKTVQDEELNKILKCA